MTTENNGQDLEINKPKVAHLDLNLSRIPLVHIRGTKNGSWSFKTENGVIEGNRRPTKGELEVYSQVMLFFEESGMPEDGTFFRTQNALMRQLVQNTGSDKKNKAIGGFQKRRLKRWLSNIRKTFISYDGCFERNGTVVTDMVGFSLLERVTLFEKKGHEEFFLSQFRLPKTIVENMRAGYWRPISLAIFSYFKSEKALALWMHLDRMLANKDEFNKDVKDLSDELGIAFTRERNYIPSMKKLCRMVINVPLTSGNYKIEFCHIVPSQTPSGFKLVARRCSVKADKAGVIPRKQKAKTIDRSDELLLDFYRNLKESQRQTIDSRIEEIAKEVSGRFWNTPLSLEKAKLESIRRYYSHDAACQKIIESASNVKLLTFRERPSRVAEESDRAYRYYAIGKRFSSLYFTAPFVPACN